MEKKTKISLVNDRIKVEFPNGEEMNIVAFKTGITINSPFMEKDLVVKPHVSNQVTICFTDLGKFD
jgi:hypothetical protein